MRDTVGLQRRYLVERRVHANVPNAILQDLFENGFAVVSAITCDGPYVSSISAIPHPLRNSMNDPYLTRYRRQIEWKVPAMD